MIALDTSVVIPALTAWHEAHDAARRAASGALVPAHTLVESYAVLTRLPAPHRLAAPVVAALLDGWFPAPKLVMPSPRVLHSFAARLADAEVTGGAAHDALVGLTAADADLELLTRDERAVSTYEALGVRHRFLRS